MCDLFTAIWITAALALSTAALQTWLKLTSRQKYTPPGSSAPEPRLKRDDAVFWTDWTVASIAALILAVAVWKNNQEVAQSALSIDKSAVLSSEENPPYGQAAGAIFAVFIGSSVIPYFLREYGYNGRNVIKWKWVAIANLSGITMLLFAVALGVEVYEWK